MAKEQLFYSVYGDAFRDSDDESARKRLSDIVIGDCNKMVRYGLIALAASVCILVLGILIVIHDGILKDGRTLFFFLVPFMVSVLAVDPLVRALRYKRKCKSGKIRITHVKVTGRSPMTSSKRKFEITLESDSGTAAVTVDKGFYDSLREGVIGWFLLVEDENSLGYMCGPFWFMSDI